MTALATSAAIAFFVWALMAERHVSRLKKRLELESKLGLARKERIELLQRQSSILKADLEATTILCNGYIRELLVADDEIRTLRDIVYESAEHRGIN